MSCRTATSSVGSVPTTVAVYVAPVLEIVTLMLVAPSTTWLLVRISPSEVRTIPVPAACAPWYCSTVLISTIPTCCAEDAVVVAVPLDPVPLDPVSPDGQPEPPGR